jgi:hypothetical protein
MQSAWKNQFADHTNLQSKYFSEGQDTGIYNLFFSIKKKMDRGRSPHNVQQSLVD